MTDRFLVSWETMRGTLTQTTETEAIDTSSVSQIITSTIKSLPAVTTRSASFVSSTVKKTASPGLSHSSSPVSSGSPDGSGGPDGSGSPGAKPTSAGIIAGSVFGVVAVLLLIGAAILVRRSRKAKRGDRTGPEAVPPSSPPSPGWIREQQALGNPAWTSDMNRGSPVSSRWSAFLSRGRDQQGPAWI